MAKKYDIMLADALVESGSLGRDEADKAEKEAESSGSSLQKFLIEKDMVEEKEILIILCKKLNKDHVDLEERDVDKDLLEKVPEKIAVYYEFMPLEMNGRIITLAIAEPLDMKIEDEIKIHLGYDIKFVFALRREIMNGLNRCYGQGYDTVEKMALKMPGSGGPAQDESADKVDDIEKMAGDASVIKLVNQVILEAWRKRATDIHIEPYRDRVSIRYRIDGSLYDANMSPEIKKFINPITSRIKIMSNLNIVERRLPQDGRAMVKVGDQTLDLRISTIPTRFGESVVIRILPSQMLFSLEKLGLSRRHLMIFENILKKPHGIFFVTGPTGSGKTTTLYACLSAINTEDRKIITIEDPVEYEMNGVTQIQAMADIGLDFARGLRSILRHDPDVIMVGEVRDLETAEIAIRVALTGHLVFSTLHTNDAAGGISRLLDIGIEPYLLASSVEVFVAQRLIRMICPDCKYEDTEVSDEIKDLVAGEMKVSSSEVKIFRGRGCPKCNSTGFFGRNAIYEVVLVDEPIKELIMRKASSDEIKRSAKSRGMQTLRQDGWRKVLLGETTPEEIIKVSPSPGKEEEVVSVKGPSLLSQAESSGAECDESERRIFKRLEEKINMHYRVVDPDKAAVSRTVGHDKVTVTEDLSAGGLLFFAAKPLVKGTILSLKVELLDGAEPLECLAKVERSKRSELAEGYDVAVCFLDLKGSERGRINKYVEDDK